MGTAAAPERISVSVAAVEEGYIVVDSAEGSRDLGIWAGRKKKKNQGKKEPAAGTTAGMRRLRWACW